MLKTSDHFDGRKFFNPTFDQDDNHSLFTAIKMWLLTKKAPWPKYVKNIATPELNLQLNPADIAITFVNHATFLIQINGLNILTDPIWSERCSPFTWLGPKRVRDPGIKFSELPNIDLVLISHNHYDHLDVATIRALNSKFNPHFIVPIGKDKKLLESLGCIKVSELDWWQSLSINDNIKICFTPTQHFSARTLFDKYDSLWGGYIIESLDQKIYFGGDSGYSRYFNDIYAKFGAMDLALIGIGAYEPRWFMQVMHTNPHEAVQAHLDLHAKHTIGMHFGTFQLSAEGIDEPLVELAKALEKLGVPNDRFITIPEGTTKLFKRNV